MKASFIVLAINALSFAAAFPLGRRQMPDIDVSILQYALTIEHLESSFYSGGLAKFDKAAFEGAGLDGQVRNRLVEIGAHEKSHVAFRESSAISSQSRLRTIIVSAALASAGEKPTEPCTYNFDYTDVKGFLATASILEGVGVSAYLGAATSITSPDFLKAASTSKPSPRPISNKADPSIVLTVESRHSAYIRSAGNGLAPFPGAYDVPLDFNQVYSLASMFIDTCPESNPKLPANAFPQLSAEVQGKPIPGGMVKLVPDDMTAIQDKGQLYAVRLPHLFFYLG